MLHRILFALILVISPSCGAAADPFLLDYISQSDPELPVIPSTGSYDERNLPLWRQALGRPEVDLQRMTAATIVLASKAGMPGVDTLIPDLRRLLSAEETAAVVRFAAARALIETNDREAAAMLWEQSQRGTQSLRQLIEPALAEWNYEPIRIVWLKRLEDPATRRLDLILAVRGLGRVAEAQAQPQLLELVHSEQAFEVRIAAAESVGMIADSGLEAEARRLLERPDRSRRLCAVALLARHQSQEATELLVTLAEDKEPPIVAKALSTLRTTAPERAQLLAEAALRHADANVRRAAIEIFLDSPTSERIAIVGRLLDDPHPGLRSRIREAFVTFAQRPAFEMAVINITRIVLGNSGWRGQQQALIALALLNDQPSVERFVELLQSPRDEVFVTAAWGLRKLAVPESAPAIVDQIRRQTERHLKESRPSQDQQVAHLCEALGVMKYAPADALLQEYIPLRPPMGALSRPSAIWALGKIYENQPNEPLAEKLMGRILDPSTEPAESSEVREMSAISLARIRATSKIDPLKKYMGPTVGTSRESLASRWAIMQLTGEDISLPEPQHILKGGWFLEVLPVRKESE